MAENKKTIIISVIAVVLFIAAISAASFAYYTANISTVGDDGNSVSGSTAKLSSSFDDGAQVNIENMIPGDSFSKTFYIGNSGAETNYKIVINDLVNEFDSYEDITYVLKEDNVVIKEGTFPHPIYAPNNELSETLTIKNGETKNYVITITYHNTEDPQDDDMGKTISGIIYIKQV